MNAMAREEIVRPAKGCFLSYHEKDFATSFLHPVQKEDREILLIAPSPVYPSLWTLPHANSTRLRALGCTDDCTVRKDAGHPEIEASGRSTERRDTRERYSLPLQADTGMCLRDWDAEGAADLRRRIF